MEFEISVWLKELEQKLRDTFRDNMLFIGLQGSYSRGEADSSSDIDVVVILDELSINDLREYKQILESMPFKEKSCGFISGKAEIQNWSKEDLFQFFNDTQNIYGRLEDIISPPKKCNVEIFFKHSLENLYHSAVHSYLHSDNLIQSLSELYKMTFFILQAKYFIINNKYISTKNELLTKLSGKDKEILSACINRKNLAEANVEQLFINLITWVQYLLKEEAK